MIQEILYLNLDRRPDRNEWFLTHMEKAGVPMEIVKRIPAKDWKDYESVSDTLIQMKNEDGLAQHLFESKPEWLDTYLDSSYRGITAYIWTMSKALKRIIESKKYTLVMHDDCSVRLWDDLIFALNYVKDVSHYIIQLSYDFPPELSLIHISEPTRPY